MSNSYYNHGSYPTTGAPGASSALRAELDLITVGFALLPTLSGNANKALVINAGGSAVTVTTGTLALAGNFATTGAFNTTLVQGATTSLTLPVVSGTLATLAGTETLSNKTLVAPALGTPASGIMTNVTGTAAGLTAGNVTINANLTGDVTSVGNATSIAAGVIVNADINASAAIDDTKLATIVTALKVSNSATTAASANTASAIVSRDASGDFAAGTVTAALTGNASTATALATGRTIAITGDLAYTSPSFDGTGNVTAAGTLATVATAGTTGSSTAIPVITINVKGLTTSITTAVVVAPAGTLTGSTLASGVTASSLTSLGTIASLVVTAGTISTTPSAATDIANKSYVDSIAQGLDTKASVVAGTTANITLSGAQTIDGISIVATDRVLVKNQTAPAENGIYVASATAWARASDMSTWAQVPGAYVFVETGTTLADTGWVCTSDAGGTLGTTAITWAQFSGAGSGVSSITFGSTGLTPSTTTTGAVTVAGTLAVANGGTGLTSGTSGGVLAYTAAGTLASSAALAASALVIGGGAGAAPSTTTTGTGVVTALGVNTGTAGAFVVNGGALGTPSSGTVTNLTGTASININGTVGATTANTGAFSTVTATGTISGTGFSFSGTAPATSLTLDASGNLCVGTATALATASGRGNVTINGSSNSILVLGNGGAIAGYVFGDANSLGFSAGSGANSRVMTFDTNGTERMRLDSSGNLGLGVTPSAWSSSYGIKGFNISNGAVYGATNDMNVLFNSYFDGTNFIYSTTAVATKYTQGPTGQHQWFNAASGTAGDPITFTQAMTLDASGNLLVGTTSASALSAGGRGLIELNGSSDSVYSYKAGGSLVGYMLGSASEVRIASFTAIPLTFYTNNSERARIDSSGNFGIGTSSPAQKLTLNTAGSDTMPALGANGGKLGIFSGGLGYGLVVGVPSSGTATLQSQYVNGTASALDMSLQPLGGNVGIGTSSPAARLHVTGSVNTYAGAGLLLGAAGVTSGYIWTTDGLLIKPNTSAGTASGSVFFQNFAGSNSIVLNTTVAGALTLDSSGNLLVGKTALSAATVGVELRPGGRVVSTLASSTSGDSTYEAYSTGAGAYRFYVDMGGTIHATSIVITAISDERLKENVRDLNTGLDAIMALKPRRFDWREGKGQDKKDVAGFIAQEFEDVFPECVGASKAGADGIEYKNINHETLIPTLVKAMQEQQALITQLTARITALETA